MRNTERRPRTLGDIGIRLVILSLAALLLMALQLTGRLRPIQSAITQLTSPAQTSATGVTENVTETFSFLAELRTLRQRAAELEQINANLLVENFRLREVERENQQLREMLVFGETRPGLELRGAQIVARVIGQESNNFLDYIMLDLGADHGVEVGMPVLTAQGLVGRISEVTNNASKVLLITDPSSAVNAILQSSRVNGVVLGDPSGDPGSPQGAQQYGDLCFAHGDCTSGLCAEDPDTQQRYCTQGCLSAGDCPATDCFGTVIVGQQVCGPAGR